MTLRSGMLIDNLTQKFFGITAVLLAGLALAALLSFTCVALLVGYFMECVRPEQRRARGQVIQPSD